LPESSLNFIGFTIGVGNRVWPPDANSNWGATGVATQENTQLFADLRGYDFAGNGNRFPVSLRAFVQSAGSPGGSMPAFTPTAPNLFTLDEGPAERPFNTSQLGAAVAGMVPSDLNRDGVPDLVYIDGRRPRIFWSFGTADGRFGETSWLGTGAVVPQTINAADIDGDGRPDLLTTDATGTLHVYYWSDFWDKAAPPGRTAQPDFSVKLAGVPGASLVADVNEDEKQDFIFTEPANNRVTVRFGAQFSGGTTYACGQDPIALVCDDFDGDASPDLAVANHDSRSVTVLLNQGDGTFSGENVSLGVLHSPVDIRTADFNRDGRQDLAVAALADSGGCGTRKALGVMLANSSGRFPTMQRICLQHTPSAILAANLDAQFGADVLIGYSDYYKLHVYASDENGELYPAWTIDPLGNVELDQVNHTLLNETNVHVAGVGLGAGGYNDDEGKIALGRMPINLIHYPGSRNLSFGLVNLGQEDALLNMELFEDKGGGRHLDHVTTTIGAGQQMARYLVDATLFGGDADVDGRWARGFLTEPETYGFWLVQNDTGRGLDGLRLPSALEAHSSLVLPVVLDAARGDTEAILINPNDEQVQLSLRLMNGGQVVQTSPVHRLKGRERLDQGLAALFPGVTPGDGDYVWIEADHPVIGMEMFGDAERTAGLEALPADGSTGVLYCPHLAAGNLGAMYESELNLLNTGDSDATLDFTVYDDSGTVFTPASIQLPARSRVNLDVATHFYGAAAATGTGYVTVDPGSAPGIVGSVSFGEQGEGRFLASLPLVRPVSDRFIVPHLAMGESGGMMYFTGMAVVNPDGNEKTVRLRAFDQDGVQVANESIRLPGHQRGIFTLEQVLTQIQQQLGGYLRVENETQPSSGLLVFVLYSGDGPVTILSALPAVPLPAVDAVKYFALGRKK
ncbi:MAG: VCBS repeat-containing protein, partial [Acidobacteria bacterium]|nr:VCBS repeat-containing protein [Acidobacteriota bacterium]